MRLIILILLSLKLISCNDQSNKKSIDNESSTDNFSKIDNPKDENNSLNVNHLFGHDFTGHSEYQYKCFLNVYKDGAVKYIYESSNKGVFAEHDGSIKEINDSVFQVQTKLTFGQFTMKSFNLDTFYISIDKKLISELNKISVKFSDNTKKHFTCYDRYGEPITLIKIPVDKKIFNNKTGSNKVVIILNRKNGITNKPLIFEIPYGSAASFMEGDKNDFYVILKNDELRTTKRVPEQTGHFKLKRNSAPYNTK